MVFIFKILIVSSVGAAGASGNPRCGDPCNDWRHCSGDDCCGEDSCGTCVKSKYVPEPPYYSGFCSDGKAPVLLGAAGSPGAQPKCPGSTPSVGGFHAKTQVSATVKGSCADVKAEIEARSRGQNGWRDPHYSGVYSFLSSTDTVVATKHTRSPGQLEELQIFTLAYIGDDSCDISACSESQWNASAEPLDFSINYCDIRNLYCGSEDGCKIVLHDFSSLQNSVTASSRQADWSQCHLGRQIYKKAPVLLGAAGSPGAQPKCPGSKAWGPHAKTQVAATVKGSCADVKAEIEARISGQNGWRDPHNSGVYSILSSTDTEVDTQRTTNPKTSVGGQVYTDKQIFTLATNGDSCDVSACSESQGTSLKDFSTNYCDIRNLYCGSADGCKTLLHDFSTTEGKVDASSGQHDFSACIVKPTQVTVV